MFIPVSVYLFACLFVSLPARFLKNYERIFMNFLDWLAWPMDQPIDFGGGSDHDPYLGFLM